jgi:hypothetical protein
MGYRSKFADRTQYPSDREYEQEVDDACLDRSQSPILEAVSGMTDYAFTMSGSKLVAKAMTSPRSGSGTLKVSRVLDTQRMKAE